MTYRIETTTNRLNSQKSRSTELILLLGLYSRTMARSEFEAGAKWVQITICEQPVNGRDRQLYTGFFVHQDQLALARPFDLQDNGLSDCPHGQ